ncbi:MAG: class I SAM-dependent methyltransferase, partial [Burkholderiales bacterium]
MFDPLEGSPWSGAGMVAGFSQSAPNQTLMGFAAAERHNGTRALDIGCGAARNALPLARLGWDVIGLDLSWPMLRAAVERGRQPVHGGRLEFALAPMEQLPIRDASVDLIVAHGIWNLASSSSQFRAAVREAARVARPAAALFVFTFSRTTLRPDDQPVAGEPFVFTQFSGEPQ